MINTSLTRKTPLDRGFEPADIHNLAAMLSLWHQRGGEYRDTVAVEVRLWGFPKSEGPALRDRIAARAERRDIPTLTVSLPEPNILSLRSDLLRLPLKPTAAAIPVALAAAQDHPLNAWDMGDFGASGAEKITLETSPVAAIVRSVIEDESFDYLLCEFRLVFPNRGSEHTLVLSGSLRHGLYRLHGIWPTGQGEFTEDFFNHTVWPQEPQLLKELENYTSFSHTTMPEWARQHLFRTTTGKAMGGPISWYLQPPNKGPGQFFLRLSVALLICSLCIFLIGSGPALRPLWPFLIGGAVMSGLAFCFTAGMKIFMIFLSYDHMKKGMQKIYSTHISHPEVNLTRMTGAMEDTALRKYTAEIEALGGQHFKDVTCDPPIPSGQFYIRIFLFPEDDSMLTLMLMHNTGSFTVTPSRASYLVGTLFTDGGKLVCTSSGSGWSKKLLTHVISRTFNDVTDPEEMLQKHRAELRIAEAAGHVRKRLVPDEIIPEMERSHNNLCEAKKKYGYFRLSDAVYMTFGLTRREYRS